MQFDNYNESKDELYPLPPNKSCFLTKDAPIGISMVISMIADGFFAATASASRLPTATAKRGADYRAAFIYAESLRADGHCGDASAAR